MCDYSLMALPNRLAVCGEELVSHRFHTGAKGFTSAFDACKLAQAAAQPKPWWQTLWNLLKDQQEQCTAVCIPPGARLLMRGLPEYLQKECNVRGELQEVVFAQTSTDMRFRDAVRFENGSELSLQKLNEGLRVKVLSLSSGESVTPGSAWPDVQQPVFGH